MHRDILYGANGPDRMLVVPAAFKERLRAGDEPPYRTVRAHDAILDVEQSAVITRVGATDGLRDPFPVVGIDEVTGTRRFLSIEEVERPAGARAVDLAVIG